MGWFGPSISGLAVNYSPSAGQLGLCNSSIISGIRTMSGNTSPRNFPVMTRRNIMSDKNISAPTSPSFFNRVVSNDSAKKGLATAAAGVLIAVITEAVWPTK